MYTYIKKEIHFLMGLAVFILTIFRVVAFLKDKRPSELYPNKSRQKLIHLVHQGFYWVILWMCISGFISIYIEAVLNMILWLRHLISLITFY